MIQPVNFSFNIKNFSNNKYNNCTEVPAKSVNNINKSKFISNKIKK